MAKSKSRPSRDTTRPVSDRNGKLADKDVGERMTRDEVEERTWENGHGSLLEPAVQAAERKAYYWWEKWGELQKHADLMQTHWAENEQKGNLAAKLSCKLAQTLSFGTCTSTSREPAQCCQERAQAGRLDLAGGAGIVPQMDNIVKSRPLGWLEDGVPLGAKSDPAVILGAVKEVHDEVVLTEKGRNDQVDFVIREELEHEFKAKLARIFREAVTL
ncbi:hypothetical protein PV04_04250 [Phialophora macrospora]|uniref:Uncharacterized protein n=1 Tax=Phialophora macrospora TaxID=1851006 RepID=A0A0D2G8P7_9EURO|nr:hypothetical protein PV04_04250 [Phialophora macrospora]